PRGDLGLFPQAARRAQSARRPPDIKNSFGEFFRTHRGIPVSLQHLIQGPPPYDPNLRASPRLSKQCLGSLAATWGQSRRVLKAVEPGAVTCLCPCLAKPVMRSRRQFTGTSCSERSCRRKVSCCSASWDRHL